MIFTVIITLLVAALTHTECKVTNPNVQQDSTIRSGEEYLDSEQSYLLKWNVSLTEKRIYFEVTANTTGYIGFGISPTGGMAGADIFIAGVHPNGTEYSSDATVRVIYAMGETDDLVFHGPNKGTKSINFFLEDASFDSEGYDSFDLIAKSEMPAQDTTYWCTLHKVPAFSEKQHVVAFEPVLKGSLALAHTHHFTLFKCVVPDNINADELFGPFVESGEGHHCFENPNNFPTSYCREQAVYGWSKGGKWTIFPSNVGYPVPDKLNRNEYYSIETHFDNPRNLSGLVIESGIRAHYTKELREHDAGLLIVNHDTSPVLTIPPNSKNFIVSGHCSSACTENELPEDGVTNFNNLFHSHLAGRKMKLRHFRGNNELSWVDVDDQYDFNYQQNKPLSTYVKVERGDQLTVECTYDISKNLDDKIVVGGLSTREEMCEAVLWYWPKTELIVCGSSKNSPAISSNWSNKSCM
ncbi:DBH-like monooxygenase protein 1 [Orchesella cincta]|uniref:DBH-like monooxygenase protein 1 n=1 Tax=Orchesella cincta TaxID=48709 RepID=A0A1D2MAL7_ORCCI|nr:DBH-like monooxygenase protein 1 [Orchesella cincta]